VNDRKRGFASPTPWTGKVETGGVSSSNVEIDPMGGDLLFSPGDRTGGQRDKVRTDCQKTARSEKQPRRFGSQLATLHWTAKRGAEELMSKINHANLIEFRESGSTTQKPLDVPSGCPDAVSSDAQRRCGVTHVSFRGPVRHMETPSPPRTPIVNKLQQRIYQAMSQTRTPRNADRRRHRKLR